MNAFRNEGSAMALTCQTREAVHLITLAEAKIGAVTRM
jgi:hypothetical protein